MWYVIVMFLGLLLGAGLVGLCLIAWIEKVKARVRDSEMRLRHARQAHESAMALEAAVRERGEEFARAAQQREEEFKRVAGARMLEIDRLRADAQTHHDDLQRRVIAYKELQEENAILKRDLQNISVTMNKLALDGERRDEQQAAIATRSAELAGRYLSETVKAVVAAIGPSNFSACKVRLLDIIGKVREIGFEVPVLEEAKLLAALKTEFEKEVRAEFERQEQARIKAQIREEEKLKREVERELKQLERERLAVQAALDQALADAKGQFSAEVESLKTRLAEAEAKSQRAVSMAQQTKAGHVYVISNLGTLGEGVFKIGMTRRLNPQERITELGDASVPFPFDVHMMIHCQDAPSLENALHKVLHKLRVNRANPRKEFFRTNIEEIREVVLKHHGEVQYIADAEALEYRQSLTMSEADAELIEEVYEAVGGDKDIVVED
jgi:hypothetical protein